MRVHFAWTDGDGTTYSPVAQHVGDTVYAPPGYHACDTLFDPSADGLLGRGMAIKGKIWADGGSRLEECQQKGYTTTLLPGTNGLIWQVDGSQIVFITTDGGRYSISISGSDLEGDELPFATGWPEPSKALQHTLLQRGDILMLNKAELMSDAALASLDDPTYAFGACVSDAFEASKPQVRKLKMLDIGDSAKAARLEDLREKWVTETQDACQTHLDVYEAALLGLIEERNAMRVKLLETTKELQLNE